MKTKRDTLFRGARHSLNVLDAMTMYTFVSTPLRRTEQELLCLLAISKGRAFSVSIYPYWRGDMESDMLAPPLSERLVQSGDGHVPCGARKSIMNSGACGCARGRRAPPTSTWRGSCPAPAGRPPRVKLLFYGAPLLRDGTDPSLKKKRLHLGPTDPVRLHLPEDRC